MLMLCLVRVENQRYEDLVKADPVLCFLYHLQFETLESLKHIRFRVRVRVITRIRVRVTGPSARDA